MSELGRDLRLAVRSLVRAPQYTLLVLLTLAVGLGATTAIFSVVEALLLRPLPYRDAGSLVVLWRYRTAVDHAPVSGPDFLDFRSMNSTLEQAEAATRADSFNVGGTAPRRVEGSFVTPGFFSLLGTPPLAGALPDSEGNGRQVVIGYRLWQEAFGGRPVIGSQTHLNGEAYTIVAVMPQAFDYPQRAEVWVPQALVGDAVGHRAYHRLHVIARLKPGVTAEQADADVKRIAKRLGELYPDTTKGIGASISTMRDAIAGEVKRPLVILAGAVLFLLLIACSNVANMTLTRFAARTRELAVRSALGADSWRIARQLLTESLVLALAGGVLAVPLAIVLVRALRTLAGNLFSSPEQIALDWAVLLFNFALAALTGVLFGLAPLGSRVRWANALRSGDRIDSEGGVHARSARELVVVAMIGLSFVLLIGAGVMVKSFAATRAIDVGIRSDHALTMRIYLPDTSYPELGQRTAFVTRFVEAVQRTSGVDAVAALSGLPLENSMSGDIVFKGEGAPVASRRIAGFTEISPGFLAAAGVPLLDGREFSWDDVRQLPARLEAMTSDPASVERLPVLVNATYARLFGHGHTLGQELFVGGELPARVIGVVGDVKQTDPRKPTLPHVYMPLGTPLPKRPMSVIIRSSQLTPAALASIARERLRRLDPNVPPYRVRTLDEVVGESVAGPRFQAVLLTALSLIALLLAATGVYGVIAHHVAQRTRELAIRMAVGASATEVVAMVMRRVGRLTVLGIVAGMLGALCVAGSLQALLYEADAAEPKTFAAVTVLTVVVAAIASAAPARRAAAVDPMTSLRSE